jgi:glycosyltransferase involved in cell wall biosynthesis
VIVVDNNSRDRTAEEAAATRRASCRRPRRGTACVARGLREATGDLVIMAEPDGTFVGRTS